MRLSSGSHFNIALESVIQHHQDTVSSVRWAPTSKDEKLALISSSFDFTVVIWRQDDEAGAWQVESSLGALVGNKHAFFGAIFLND